jgi:hypothetical protein
MTTFTKGVYFHDFVDNKNLKEDLKHQVILPCEKNEIFFENGIECYDEPQCLDGEFDVLFFDWGGMSLGNSLLESFCREIYNQAENQQNRFFVMVSSFTEEAMKDAVEEFGKERPFNLFLSVDDFGSWLKKYEQ